MLPFASEDEVNTYFEEREDDLRRKLKQYNQKHKIALPLRGIWNIVGFGWQFDRFEGDSLFVVINYFVGTDFNPNQKTALFELVWRDDELVFASHDAAFVKRKKLGPGVLPTVGKTECVYNYFAPKPCPDAKRRWEEFAALNDLPVDQSSAAAFQAFMQNDKALGDRLVAVARGLPDPGGRSVFDLQAEVQRLNPGQYQKSGKEPCGLNPYGVKPCPEIGRVFQEFAERHGLDTDRRSGRMFEAYSKGDYKQADVLYAVAKNLPVPKYGHVPTGIASDVQGLNLARYQDNRSKGCDLNPYGPKPCLEIISVWREFAERYDLADNQANARIFAAYGEGEMKRADQLFAQAKGVSMEQLLEAAGQPTPGLVIEVYPSPKRNGKSS